MKKEQKVYNFSNMTKFSTIILCGGKGPEFLNTQKTPKCLININGKPFLYYQLNI